MGGCGVCFCLGRLADSDVQARLGSHERNIAIGFGIFKPKRIVDRVKRDGLSPVRTPMDRFTKAHTSLNGLAAFRAHIFVRTVAHTL